MKLFALPAVILLSVVSTTAALALDVSVAVPPSSEKGGFQHAQPPALPQATLELAPITAEVRRDAAERCGGGLAAAALDFGGADAFKTEREGRGAGAALVGALLGGRAGRGKPKLQRDPIGKRGRERFNHPAGVRLSIGGEFDAGGSGLLLSMRVDKSRSKSTFHSVFLERRDCTRLWPTSYEPYGVWGDWSLSVRATKTTSRYRNGALIDRSVERGSWQGRGSGLLSLSILSGKELANERLLLDPDRAFTAHLAELNAEPAWQDMGFDEPTGGIRTAGARFDLQPGDLVPAEPNSEVIAVVHLTDVGRAFYRTHGFAFRVSELADGTLSFEQLAP